MSVSQKALVALVAGIFLSGGAYAAAPGQPYVGVKVGQFMLGEDIFDDVTAYGVFAGYNFTPEAGLEVEYVDSSSKTIDVAGVDLDYKFKTYGAYGTYRYIFPNTALYAKGKIGFAKAEVKASALSISKSGSDSGLAGGLGLGYNFNPNMAVEAEYAYVAKDADLLTVGASFKF